MWTLKATVAQVVATAVVPENLPTTRQSTSTDENQKLDTPKSDKPNDTHVNKRPRFGMNLTLDPDPGSK